MTAPKESLSLETTLRQQQRLTPLQVQYVRMLEMTAPEVEDAVRRAVDEMPALEVSDDVPEDNPSDTIAPNAGQEGAPYADETPYYKLRSNNYSPDYTPYDAAALAPEREQTLIEALTAQLSLTDMSDRDRLIALNIIGNLDDNGYMTRDLQSIADDIATRTSSDDVTADDVYRVWQAIRSLDPAGVGAVDLRDCLLLQLKRLTPSPEVNTAIEIVTHYFDIFSKMHYDRLMATAQITESQLRDALDVIRKLNPKPGGAFATGRADDSIASQVTPDFNIDIDGDRLVLSMLTRLPHLSVERSFAEDTPITPGTSRRERENVMTFIKSKRDEAQTFIKVLSMRQETLYRVMQAIVKIQRDFFLTGDEALIKPMILRDISEMTGYGLSVISRATSGKYVSTPYGTYSLKSLFNERPKEDSDASAPMLQAQLRMLIEAEDPSRPLSDQRLTDLMNRRGYDLARRTVAKYRENMGIPVARLRRRL